MLLFEMPDSAALRSRGGFAGRATTAVWRVAVLLRSDPGDLATLLREVEAWAASASSRSSGSTSTAVRT